MLALFLSAQSAQAALSPPQGQNNAESLDITALRQKAEGGDVSAQVELGQRYTFAKGGVALDYAQARAWFEKAADKGNTTAEQMLGNVYEYGWGVTQDFVRARSWFQKAADQGFAPAQNSLGYLYERGEGVAQDNAQARFWYQKAADQGSALAQQRLAALKKNVTNSSTAADCNPNWSSQWDQLERQYQERLRQPGIVDQAIQGSGGLQTLLAAEKTETEGSDLEALERTENSGAVPAGWTPEQYLAFRRGLFDIAHCRARVGRSNTTSTNAGEGDQSSQPRDVQSAPSPQLPAQIDLRYLRVDSRPLTDAEMRDLRNSLHWEAESVPLTLGGAARSNLVDDKGRRFGSILVRWDRTTTPKATPSKAPGEIRGYFTVQIENGTSCALQSSAEFDDNQGFIVVSGVTWGGWLTLHQPERGQTSQVQGSTAMNQAYASLVLKPLTAYSTLSACMTPKNP